MLDAIISGTLLQVIGATGRWLAVEAKRPPGRLKQDAEIAKWFDTYKLTSSMPELPQFSADTPEPLAAAIQSNQVQASLHELLAVRLTDAPEADVERVRLSFDAAIYDSLGGMPPDD